MFLPWINKSDNDDDDSCSSTCDYMSWLLTQKFNGKPDRLWKLFKRQISPSASHQQIVSDSGYQVLCAFCKYKF